MKSRLVLVIAGCLALTACQSLSMPKVWPFYKKPKPGPEVVHEIDLVGPDGAPASYPQYWKRNTLIVDLSGVAGQGSVAARLREETTWPVRMAVRVKPGSVGQLEVQGEERNVLPVIAAGADVVDIELVPSLYTPRTAAIYIAWAPQTPAVETAPVEEERGFVSPTEVPRPQNETQPNETAPTDTPAPAASDIVPPGEIAPTQSPGG